MVMFKGMVVIVKKLKLFDVMDCVVDIQDDVSEFRGKKVIFQFVSSEVDLSELGFFLFCDNVYLC